MQQTIAGNSAGEEGGISGSTAPALIVGIGGSAGALPAIISLLKTLESDAPLALVVVLHLAPDHESYAAEILQRSTLLTVRQVTQRTLLQAGHVYVIAPGTNLITDDGHVRPAIAGVQRPSAAIDLFFRTLAHVHGERAVGIVLSGTGRDGSMGIVHVKERNGFTIAQAPEECEQDDMPRAAIATGSVDLIMTAADIGRYLRDISKNSRTPLLKREEVSTTDLSNDTEGESVERAYQEILALLRTRARHDFRHYKRGTVTRRIERRMQVHRLSTVQAYRDFVQSNPQELMLLQSDLLISVTNFFRDKEAFDALYQKVVPRVMKSASEAEKIRVWVAACASGEESYSVAILLQEYADQMTLAPRIQIFSSDVNDAALRVARAALYPSNIATDVPEARLRAFFDKEGSEFYRVRTVIRENIVFARHNLLSDPPFSRLDLICCRNLLIYLDRTAQAAALDIFAYALKPGGYLFLGNAESIDLLPTAFEAVDKENRIYRLRSDAIRHARIPSKLLSLAPLFSGYPGTSVSENGPLHPPQSLAALHASALMAASAPSVLIDEGFDIERVSAGAGRFVSFGEGVPTRNLLNNVALDIRMELQAALLSAAATQQSVRSVFRRRSSPERDAAAVLALTVDPVKDNDGEGRHWLVRFDESVEQTLPLLPQADDRNPVYREALQRLEEANQSLKVRLQETLDRSAVSNEELKASNEELQAINEELRSAKEELETSKEELQSVNEELTTVNFELRLKVEESSRNNDDLRNLMEASEIATIFVDAAMRVKRFTPQATKLFALIPSDIGRPLTDVKSRLEYADIVEDAEAVFRQLRPVERSVSSVDARHFFVRILPYRTGSDKISGAVLSFVDVTDLRDAQDMARLTETRLRDAVAASKDFAVMSTDLKGKVTSWNEGATRIFGYEPDDILGKPLAVLFTADDQSLGMPERERSEAVEHGRAATERWHLRKDGTVLFCSSVMTPLRTGGDFGFLKIARDVAVNKALEFRRVAPLTEEQRAADQAGRHLP